MALISTNNVHLAFGSSPVFDGIDIAIEKGERVCIVGRNGAGKSTLLKMFNKDIQPDEGEVHFQKNLRFSMLDQHVPDAFGKTCYQVIASGLAVQVDSLQQYHQLLSDLEKEPEDSSILDKLSRLQKKIDEANLWDVEHQIQKIASLLSIDCEQDFSALSGGRKRRVWLARALVGEPDILFLDEPTNHVDMETVLWMENFLANWQGTLVFISHDRHFINHLATRILELDRGKVRSFPGNYAQYLEEKQHLLATEQKQNRLFDKKLADEEVWIRQGVKARRTRNEGRVRELEQLREKRRARIDKQGVSKFDIATADKSSKVVIEAKDLSFSFEDGKCILKDFSTLIMRGDKVGIIGANGSGKSTLLNILLGKIKCQQGELKLADNLQIAYFDQLRETLDDSKSIIENVAEGSDFIEINDRKVHIVSYLKDFLFAPERLHTPLSALSGGERNRVLMAKLFARPSNLLVLDEPTNDLDIETLELLEARLQAFPGTLILISHDRSFLNNIVTSTLVFERHGVQEYVGGYDDWLLQREDEEASSFTSSPAKDSMETKGASLDSGTRDKEGNQKNRKLSYKEQRELESLPKKIETYEEEIQHLHHELSDSRIYQEDQLSHLKEITERLESLEYELDKAMQRWLELEA